MIIKPSLTIDNTTPSRIVLGVEYNGSAYHGWQLQRKPEVDTVQGRVESALSSVADTSVRVHCAGRTDAGVHAVEQVVHFETCVKRPLKAWVQGANSLLPPSVRILWATSVADDFHARHSALARRYQYWILNTSVASALLAGGVTHCRYNLDVTLMHDAAQALLGEQDFSAFRAASCESRTAMRNVHFINVSRRDDFVCIDIQANAFLLHMVRNIVGSLLEVGAHRQPTSWISDLLQRGDRTQAAATAKPFGLYLYHVDYPQHYGLPQSSGRLPFA